MTSEWTALFSAAAIAVGLVLYVVGGLRFRRWAVEDRPGIPRFSNHVETIILWMLYSAGLSIAIIVIRQTLRHL
ncbi:MAG TPA: hypothetical protein ENI85_07515 [Deltaproteobacteria bacterium]|nr:hypothetical protein [Deltaproteobacteria bacterium]